jgi:hypothetical protein
LSALITPATLTVVSVRDNETIPGQVPQVYFPRFDSTGSIVDDARRDNEYVGYRTPSTLLTRISFATASSMGVLPMPAGTPNSTYVVNFNGPSLKCEEPSPEMIGIIDYVVHTVGMSVSPGGFGGGPVYTAFTPAFSSFVNHTRNSTNFRSFVDACVVGADACSFEPGNLTAHYASGTKIFGRLDPLVISLDKNYTCALKNTSYSVMFRSSTEQTTLDLISFDWNDVDPSFDITYGAIGMAVAQVLTGTYYRQRFIVGDDNVFLMSSIRTSIGATAMMGLVNEVSNTRLNGATASIKQQSADLALTRNKTMGELVEEFSRNLTLSLFSSTSLM